MKFWHELRWQMVFSHLVVVIVGVLVLLLTTQFMMSRITTETLQVHLQALSQAETALDIQTALDALLNTFNNTLLFALLIAALASIVAGSVTSVLLTRLILNPLKQITYSSQRIADGHYDERVEMPGTTELIRVATTFNQMASALEDIEQKRIALIGNVSHELRTPLSGIEGYLEGMMDGVMPGTPETYSQMYQEMRRLRRLVDDLQALSRVEAGQMSLRIQDFDAADIIERVSSQLHPQIMAQNQSFSIERSCGQLPVHADPDRTAQILLNLVGNAIRYTPEGGAISIQCQKRAQAIDILVKDTGIGIPEEALPYLFERFYRVDSSRSRRSGGSGIGLTISRHLAWAMQGNLTAFSTGRNQGSIFTLRLPSQ